MTIARLIEGRSSEVVSCDAALSVREAVAVLAERRIGALPVFDGGTIAGIFSERDVVYQLAANGPAMLSQPVSAVMTAPAITVSPQTDVLEALGLMTDRKSVV